LRVTDIASPLFKVDWPGAPASKFSPKSDKFHADFGFTQQDDVLRRSIELAKQFQTDRVRCFDFWRLENQAPYRKAITRNCATAAAVAAKSGIKLVLENEMTCNTATAAEAAQVLAAIPDPNLLLNWDPGNAAAAGETPYPDGYRLLPKGRIGHCHCKDATRKPDGSTEWASHGQRHHRLGGTIPRAARRRLSPRRQPGNALARRRDAGRILAAKLGWNAKELHAAGDCKRTITPT